MLHSSKPKSNGHYIPAIVRSPTSSSIGLLLVVTGTTGAVISLNLLNLLAVYYCRNYPFIEAAFYNSLQLFYTIVHQRPYGPTPIQRQRHKRALNSEDKGCRMGTELATGAGGGDMW